MPIMFYFKNALKIVKKYFENNEIDFLFGTVKKTEFCMVSGQKKFLGNSIYIHLILVVSSLEEVHIKKLDL